MTAGENRASGSGGEGVPVIRDRVIPVVMVLMNTEVMISQNLDHAAFPDRAMRTLRHHLLQLAAQRRQLRDPPVHRLQLRLRDGVGSGAGLVRIVLQGQQVADRVEWKAKVAGMADEKQSCQGIARIEALVPFAPTGGVQKADLLVIADRRHLDPGGLTQFSDRQHFTS